MNTMVFLLAMCPFFCVNQTTENNLEEITHHYLQNGEDEAVCSYAGLLSLCTGPYEQGGYQAYFCGNCGFGAKKNNCARCGKWIAQSGVPAKLCSSCGFGAGKNNCVRCGKWIAQSGVPAKLCGSCGFGAGKNNCVRCGKWAN